MAKLPWAVPTATSSTDTVKPCHNEFNVTWKWKSFIFFATSSFIIPNDSLQRYICNTILMATLSFVHFVTTENLLYQDSLYRGSTVLLLFYPKYWTDSDRFENTQPCPYSLHTFKDKWNVLTTGMAKTKEYQCYTVELCSDRKILQADHFGCLKPMPHDAQVWSAASSHSACSCRTLVQCRQEYKRDSPKASTRSTAHPDFDSQPACFELPSHSHAHPCTLAIARGSQTLGTFSL